MNFQAQPENMFSVIDVLRKLRNAGYLGDDASRFGSLMDIVAALGVGDLFGGGSWRGRRRTREQGTRRAMHTSRDDGGTMDKWPTEGTRW